MEVSPVKVFRTRKLNIQSYTCLICGNIASKDILRTFLEKGTLILLLILELLILDF